MIGKVMFLEVSTILGGVTAAGTLVYQGYHYLLRRDLIKPFSQPAEIKHLGEVALEVPDIEGLTFRVLHVRDGREPDGEHGPLLNKVYDFKRIGDSLKADIAYTENLGFQYKCFVDFTGSKKDAQTALKRLGFKKVFDDADHPERLWFLLPDRPIFKTPDNLVNNFRYPV